MKSVEEIVNDQISFGKKENKEIIEKPRKNRKDKRIMPQLSATLDSKSMEFLKDMTLFYSMKKKKVFTYSKTLRIILKYARDMEHELQDYI